LREGFIVFDEAHVYVNINYLDLVAAIKLYRHELNSSDRESDREEGKSLFYLQQRYP